MAGTFESAWERLVVVVRDGMDRRLGYWVWLCELP